MAGRRDIYMTDQAAEDLAILAERWALASKSATIARALREAVERGA